MGAPRGLVFFPWPSRLGTRRADMARRRPPPTRSLFRRYASARAGRSKTAEECYACCCQACYSLMAASRGLHGSSAPSLRHRARPGRRRDSLRQYAHAYRAAPSIRAASSGWPPAPLSLLQQVLFAAPSAARNKAAPHFGAIITPPARHAAAMPTMLLNN